MNISFPHLTTWLQLQIPTTWPHVESVEHVYYETCSRSTVFKRYDVKEAIAGFRASVGDDLLVTDSRSWKCTTSKEADWMQPTFDDSSWSAAVVSYPNSNQPGHFQHANWIWTKKFVKPDIDPVVYCRGHLCMFILVVAKTFLFFLFLN